MDIIAHVVHCNGLISVGQAEEAGIPRARLSEAAAVGELERVARGVYCLPDAWEDEYAVACLRFRKGVLSHGTALFLHDLTDRTPERVTMTFPRTYNASSARGEGITVRTCANGLLELGVATVATPSGNSVRCYDVERTLCDMLRGRAAVDVQVVNPAMRAYVRSPQRDLQKIMRYAQQLGVENKVRNYLEVLL